MSKMTMEPESIKDQAGRDGGSGKTVEANKMEIQMGAAKELGEDSIGRAVDQGRQADKSSKLGGGDPPGVSSPSSPIK